MSISPLKNQYKRLDVFRCSQDAHKGFGGRVSVYHVLKEKACYPQGCIYFLWHCVLLQKGNRCIHGYTHTGKSCRGCTYYDEEKVHLQPECLLTDEAYSGFLEELERFEEWLQRVRYRRIPIAGKIHAVKPWFEMTILAKETHKRLRGYLLVFKRGFFETQPFDDTFYVRVSEGLMREHGFVPKMKIELTGEVREDRGRIVVHHPGRIETLNRGWGRPLTRERALVGLKTAVELEGQPDQCLACPWGGLVDVTDNSEADVVRYRTLWCLKSVADPEGCYVNAMRRTREKRKKRVNSKS